MDVESRESRMHSGFFHLKNNSFNIAEQKNFIKKVIYDSYPLKKIPSDHGEMVTKYAGAGRVQTIKKISSLNRLEILVLIILGCFLIHLYLLRPYLPIILARKCPDNKNKYLKKHIFDQMDHRS
jgi:hypothetical protein